MPPGSSVGRPFFTCFFSQTGRPTYPTAGMPRKELFHLILQDGLESITGQFCLENRG